MVTFSANSAFLDRLDGNAEAVRLDAILPDVLRRYGLAPAPSREENARPTPSPALPAAVWSSIAAIHTTPISGVR